jgi:nitroimidazol reductase NimA-like FMN-containing flavoprotein (pyridoxamine 5'-phosphate oxidase superfamily)
VNDLGPEECRAVLDEGRVAHIAVVSEGEPYVTPMSYVMRGEDFVFRTITGRRIEALRANPRVCVEVTIDGPEGWRSVLFWGTARFLDDARLESEIIGDLLAKYHSNSLFGASTPTGYAQERVVVAVTPERLGGRASGTGLHSQSRPGRL